MPDDYWDVWYGNTEEDWSSTASASDEAEARRVFYDISEHPEKFGPTDGYRASYAVLRKNDVTVESWEDGQYE